jgi:hypothetical protein
MIGQRTVVRSLIRTNELNPLSVTLRGFATSEKNGVPQPPKQQVQQRVEALREYNERMRELRRDLVAQGVSKQSMEALREQRIAEGKSKVGRKFTREQKQEMLKTGQERHEAYIGKFKAVYEKQERKRILKETIRRTKGEAFRELNLTKAQKELAADIDQTWGKLVKDDLKAIVPVNAPYLGVLPKHHADVAPIFGDDVHKIRQMYGPPKPLPPAENQYNGIDPRIVEYTSERRSFPPDWKQRRFRPSNNPSGNNSAPPPSGTPPS